MPPSLYQMGRGPLRTTHFSLDTYLRQVQKSELCFLKRDGAEAGKNLAISAVNSSHQPQALIVPYPGTYPVYCESESRSVMSDSL